jgi:hypothetical protein
MRLHNQHPLAETKQGFKIIACLLVVMTLMCGRNALAIDEENCLICHKLQNFGIYESDDNDNQVKRLFSIEEGAYKETYHGRLRCAECHTDITKIPHSDPQPVNCAIQCHVKDPSSNSWYSHANISNDLKESVHGGKSDNMSDFPDCKFCHVNKPYQLVSEDYANLQDFITICTQCHESTDWTRRFFKHMNYRAHIRRSSKDIVSLCSKCHTDNEMMGRHNLDVVVGFNDTFHGQAIKYGDTEVANCLNCHAPYQNGFSPHRIHSQHDTNSPVSHDNKLKTCRQSGCHVDAKEEFASNGKVHPSSYGMVSWLRPKISHSRDGQENEFQRMVIYFIKLFYKILIVLVVGGLGMHQMLNLMAMRRESRRSKNE